MPSIDVAIPVSSVPTDRLALGVGWVRPGAGSICCTLNPSTHASMSLCSCVCFEGNDE
ncbi:unannotated protein [freshwater metagenome]|uniref:Unannotated protein n=1 Tax=freshwater metagenome TaxID=449393 RepID=A0A6J6P3R2_9ZZZZ|nr:hypothetical protein [Actinomycetota bacterium]MSW10600.1 hypothetical protein [Actinomycetota bacterium]MSX13132.1 hypothetical protein [Actinomycetota bacterium]MSY16374.1 hypothetical protein [Actinomycetota bacterium]MSY40637.1 hypothetical protein [Actinomycetota bacterium]